LKYAVFFMILIALLVTPHLYTEWKYDRPIKREIESSLENFEMAQNQRAAQSGYVGVKGTGRKFTEKQLHRMLGYQPAKLVDSTYYWQYQGVRNVTASAQGLDRLHHFANSYLVGFEPFETQSIWVPLYTLAIRKQYEFDRLQYSGLADVWQNSRQAFFYTRGDCEDHAIILADWLISMGLDARVVLGEYHGEGHAWVVLLVDGKEYLLEATGKKKMRSLNDFKLTKLVTGYSPMCQFNRNLFWYNEGNKLTTRYTGNHWVLKSRFVSHKKDS
jgi:hypothetical protein